MREAYRDLWVRKNKVGESRLTKAYLFCRGAAIAPRTTPKEKGDKEMAKTQTETRLFTDALIAAYMDLKGFTIRPRKMSNGRIAFEISGDQLNEVVESFYNNEKVPVATFCSAYRNVRSMMFNAKGDVS